MHTQHVNTAAPESSKTWGNGQKICVSANDLRNRWHTLGGENVTPAEGMHFPARNGSYGSDVLILDETEVNALIEAGHKALPRVACSARGMTALYDAGEASVERYISSLVTTHKILLLITSTEPHLKPRAPLIQDLRCT